MGSSPSPSPQGPSPSPSPSLQATSPSPSPSPQNKDSSPTRVHCRTRVLHHCNFNMYFFLGGGGDSHIALYVSISDFKARGPGFDFPVGAKKFSDGTCKYLPFVELLLC